ncbi:MAG: POTRA domain-containing protein, partial [Gemmatimonadales bacterium]
MAAMARPALGQLEPLQVRGVHFQGVHGVDPLVLAASIATTQSSAFARWGLVRWFGFGDKRYFNQLEFTRDVYRLQVVFKRSGYPDVKVDTVVKRMPGAVDVTFKISEGPPNRLASLAVVGLDSVDTPSLIRQDLPIVAGDVASDYKLHETADTITFRLWNHGYPSATVAVDESGGADKTNARLVAHTGLHSKFGPIRVTAPLGVDTSHVSALINARPGDEYRFNTILQSQRSLYTSDLYRVA